MKLRNIALNTLFYFLYAFGACVIVMLAEALALFILQKFVVIPYPVLTVLRIVIYTLGVTALLAVIGYYEGYREGTCSVSETFVGGLAAMVPHILFAMLFNFQGFVSGAVRFVAGLLHNGWAITYESLLEKTPYGLFLLVFVVYGLLYTAALTVAKMYGAQKRALARSELRRSETAI